MDPVSERRLAAILFTDIVGSTAVTARSESAGLALRDRHRDLVRTQVAELTISAAAPSLRERYLDGLRKAGLKE